MSFDLDDQDTREDVRRIAAALERTDEQLRQERHHDVLCVALSFCLENTLPHVDADKVAAAARMIADAVYPPPTETK